MTNTQREINVEVVSRAYDVDAAGELLPIAWVRVTVETAKGPVEREYKAVIREGLVTFQRLSDGLVVEEYQTHEFGCSCGDATYRPRRPGRCKHAIARSVLLGKQREDVP